MRRSLFIIVLTLGLARTASAGQGQKAATEEAKPEPVPAEYVFKNVQIFRGRPAAQMIPVMTWFTQWFGVDCLHCHTQYEWDKDDKAPKQTARQMFSLIRDINQDLFGGNGPVTCWTCHRGASHPLTLPANLPEVRLSREEEDAFSKSTEPSEKIYRNIETLRGMPAARLSRVMTTLRKVLGVECAHCHIPGQWERDDKAAKLMARKMFAMVQKERPAHADILDRDAFDCWTCHRGTIKPESLPK